MLWTKGSVKAEMGMNSDRAKELLVPLRKGRAEGISKEWAKRLVEALERVIELEKKG